MFKKNLRRSIFSLIIITMLFSSTVSFGSGFGTYRSMLQLFNNIQWRQVPIFRCVDEKQPSLPIKPEEPVDKVEVPVEEEKEEEKEEVVEVEKPVAPERPSRPEETTEEPVEETTEKPAEEVKQEAPSSSVSQEEQEVLRLVNIEREKAGLAPLKLSSELSRVARDKSKDMAHNNYFSHTSPTHGSPFDMMKSYGINYRTAGENIAKGYGSAASVVNGWMNSSGHRANILNSSFGTLGVGYYNHNGTAYWTQMFTN